MRRREEEQGFTRNYWNARLEVKAAPSKLLRHSTRNVFTRSAARSAADFLAAATASFFFSVGFSMASLQQIITKRSQCLASLSFKNGRERERAFCTIGVSPSIMLR
jgi:hypothetical protein